MNIFSRTSLFTTALLTLAVASTSFAGSSSSKAIQRVENVITNNASANIRGSLQSKLNDVQKDVKSLENSLEGLENIVNNSVSSSERPALLKSIENLRKAIGKDIGDLESTSAKQTPTAGYFCTSACKNFDGTAIMGASSGAIGTDKLIGQQAASDKLATEYTCRAGVVEVGCEVRSSNATAYTCQAGCKNFDGTVVTGATAVGQGNSEAEAFNAAKAGVEKQYTCSQGIIKSTCVKN